MSMGMTSAPPVATKDAPSWRLVSMMTVAGALAGLLIVTTYEVTLPRIQHHQAETMAAAIQEVLRAPARYDTLYLHGGKLVKGLPAGADEKTMEKIFLGYDAAGHRVGFAMSAIGVGFQDPMTVMFGYDADRRQVIAMRVIANKETPGLGDKIVKDTGFVAEFSPVGVPIEGLKKDRATGAADEVAMITGATVSSRAVIRIINDAVARWQPLMDDYREGPTS
jgi:electron transport complex protein RnfG